MKSPANSAPHLHRWRNPPATPAVRPTRTSLSPTVPAVAIAEYWFSKDSTKIPCTCGSGGPGRPNPLLPSAPS